MRVLIIIFCCLCGYTSGAQQLNAFQPGMDFDSLRLAQETAAVGKPFPDFNTISRKKPFSKKNLAGKIVFINFWFATCPPCIAEFDALNELYNHFKNNPRFIFLSFTWENEKTIAATIKKYGMAYRVCSVSENECYALNQGNGFPTSIILDGNGIIRMIKSGGDPKDKKKTRAKVMDGYGKILTSLLAGKTLSP